MSKRSYVYLDPMSPDGKTPGAVKEIVYDGAGAQQFLEPVSYVANDDLGKLRAQVHKAQAELRHAKARGVGVAEAQTALEAAKTAMGKVHYNQQKEREQQRTGAEGTTASPFSRQSANDTRVFMEVVDYSTERDDGLESPSEELSEEELATKILAAVRSLEQALSNGTTPIEMLRLEEELRALTALLPNPSAPPADTTAAPPRRSAVPQDAPGTKPAGQVAATVPVVKTWKNHLADLDRRLAARALAALPPVSTAAVTHDRNICCSGKYLCPSCKAKAAAVA